MNLNPQRILVIRRDNIGDLICTTPMIRLLRQQYPDADIDVLVNSYNIQAIEHNPDINQAFAYTKAKHRKTGESLWQVHWQRLKLLWLLRRKRYDIAILAGNFSQHALRLAKQIKPQSIISFAPSQADKAITHPITPSHQGHEVERSCELLKPLGIAHPIPAMILKADQSVQHNIQKNLLKQGWRLDKTTLAIHISARKLDQRWPKEQFIELIHTLNQTTEQDVQILLFWAPGDENNPQHPGDNQKAQFILEHCVGLPVYPVATQTLRELIAGLNLANKVLCSDGGAMHIAAGLGKSIVCFFGSSDVEQWRPWGVECVVLQPKTQPVKNVKVHDVLNKLTIAH